jgi:hypothetical protein
MCRSRSEPWRLALVLASLLAGGCELEPGQYRFGVSLPGLRFQVLSDDVGVHPSQDVLGDPLNPFRHEGVGDATKWQILTGGGPVAAFYAWGTLLARVPTGEHQLYTARSAADVYASYPLSDADRPRVRAIALRGYQAVLDAFPDSVTYDATGTIAYRLATPAYLGILELGGTPRGDWVLVTTPDGGQQAVQGSTELGRPATREGD